MQAWLHLVRIDLGELGRSWPARAWALLLAAGAAYLAVVAARERELASETLGFYMQAGLAPLSWLAVSYLAASAVSGEADVAADSILSRSVSRGEYIQAKIAARVGAVLAVCLAVSVPFAYCVDRYAVGDVSGWGVAGGLAMVCALAAALAAFGIALSVAARRTAVAVAVVLPAAIVPGVVLQQLGLNWMSALVVLDELPRTFRGETSAWFLARTLLVFALLAALSAAAAVRRFRRKDL